MILMTLARCPSHNLKDKGNATCITAQFHLSALYIKVILYGIDFPDIPIVPSIQVISGIIGHLKDNRFDTTAAFIQIARQVKDFVDY